MHNQEKMLLKCSSKMFFENIFVSWVNVVTDKSYRLIWPFCVFWIWFSSFFSRPTNYSECFHPFTSRIESLSLFSLLVYCTQHSWELLDQVSHQSIPGPILLILKREVFTLLCVDKATDEIWWFLVTWCGCVKRCDKVKKSLPSCK